MICSPTGNPSDSPQGTDIAGVPANDITPAHVRYALAFSTDGKAQMDYTVRVRDHNGKLGLPTDKNLFVSTAAMMSVVIDRPDQLPRPAKSLAIQAAKRRASHPLVI